MAGVRDKIAERLKNPDCRKYITKLINEAARQNRRNPAVSTNLLDIFDLVNAQGKFHRRPVGTRQNPSHSTVRGYIPKGNATVYLAPLKVYPDMSAEEIARGNLSLDPIDTFHELTHLAGSKVYDDLQLSSAARALGGPTLPTDRDNRNLAFSRYFEDALTTNCVR